MNSSMIPGEEGNAFSGPASKIPRAPSRAAGRPDQASRQERRSPTSAQKRHLGEIDIVRSATIAGVVAVHTVGLTGLYFGSGALFGAINNGAVTLLHFTRESFMFLTGLVLFYQYRDRGASTWQFWGKRFPPTLIPYLFWSVFYILTYDIPAGDKWGLIVTHLWRSILLGTASYHLYYMLITFQFYLLFPLLLLLFKRHPEWSTATLVLSALVTVAWFAFLGPSNVYPDRALWPWGARFQSHFFLPYVFYFVLGAWVALHLDAVLSYLRAHRRAALFAAIAVTVLLEVHYTLAITVEGAPMSLAVTVLQPMMVPYCVGVLLFLFLLAFALEGESPIRAYMRRMTSKFADLSFGVYLCHVAFLSVFLNTIDPWLRWPAPLLMLITWPTVIAASVALTVLFGRFRLTAILMGQKAPQRGVAKETGLPREATT